MQSNPQALSRLSSPTYSFRIIPYVIVILLCFVSQPSLRVGSSKSEAIQISAPSGIDVSQDRFQSTVAASNRFELFANTPASLFPLSNSDLNPPQPSGNSADGVWGNIKKSELATYGRRVAGPRAYRTLNLNRGKLTTILTGAPQEFSSDDSREAQLTLPLPDGTFHNFRVVASPIMEPALAARFPEIQTYSGQSIDDPNTTTRFDWTPQGFHAVILSSQGTVLIEPYTSATTDNYIVYFQRDVPVDSFDCDVSADEQEIAVAENNKLRNSGVLRPVVFSGSNLRTYRLAVAATAEYTQTYGGGTVSGALSAITTTINSVDAIYEREVAIRLVLVSNETAIIFTDTTTDGYTSDSVSALISENQTKLDSVIGPANYDIGHVFDGRNEAPGFFSFQGLATLSSVCRDGAKARGVSITRSIQPSSVVAYYSTAHEMGHQFGASHTFNATTGSCASQRSPSTAYEPGTGSTIMGYRFTCGAEDLMSSDTYFHIASLEQIVNYSSIGNGSSCPVLIANGNSPPGVDAGGGFYTIPQGTPFFLGALGRDADGDDLTFCWEEFDLGAPSPPSTDDGSRPIFRSFAPTASPSRSFPKLSDVLSGFASFGESLPVTTRTMNFRVTARDNRLNGGGINAAEMRVEVRADSGPFKVTQPGSGANWVIGTPQTISWAVANTNAPPIDCSSVRILMSIDGGFSFPIILSDNTPNDGSETLTPPVAIPSSSSFAARIKVAARGNIFFNISPALTIVQPSNSMQFGSASYSGSEADNPKLINVIVTRTGDLSGGATANYATSDNSFGAPCNTSGSGRASSRCDYEVTAGTVFFAPGEAAKTIPIAIVDDSYPEGAESLQISLSNIVGASFGSPTQAGVTINDNEVAPGPNQIDQASYFVRQHYIDFLNREPDASGLAFWTDQIAQCGADTQCIEIKRINVSAAFYLSIEFQETGFLVYRLYKAAYGEANGTSTIGGPHSLKVPIVRQDEFFADTRRIGEGVVVGQPGWEQVLENNKQRFVSEFVQRTRFAGSLGGLIPTKFVDALNSNAGNPLSTDERNQLVADLTFGVKTTGQVLRAVAEDPDLVAAEKNRAFVLMQYFGYLRRNPNDAPDSDHSGYDFWLTKLNQFGGNFVNAEMVKAFITSGEYRQRFGP